MQFGNSGVSLFFVLSGFVITRILLESVNSNTYFRTFYVRRVLRIFPLYYFALICYYYLPYLLNDLFHYPPSFSLHIYYYTYLQNFARTFQWESAGPLHFWSLAVEEHFYLLWPAIVYVAYRFKKESLLYISGLLIFLSLALRFYMLSKDYTIDFFTFTRLDQLVLGGILAILERENLLKLQYKNIYITSFVVGAVFFMVCILLNGFYQDLFKHDALGLLYFGAIALCIIYENKGMITRFLKLPLIQYLGTISYGIYVWHAIALNIVDQYFITHRILLDFVLVILLTVIIASVSYWILEKPFLKLKRFFSYG